MKNISQPTYTNCANCGTAHHRDYACHCRCHSVRVAEVKGCDATYGVYRCGLGADHSGPHESRTGVASW